MMQVPFGNGGYDGRSCPPYSKILAWLEIEPEDFCVSEVQFDHESEIHGPDHVYRVMLHVLNLAWLRADSDAGRLAFFAAYIHDFARKDDSVDPFHGQASAEKKLPIYEPLFRKYGATDETLGWIWNAVAQHSTRETLTMADSGWIVLALLKDADALDRCRFMGLDPNRLRLKESFMLVDWAEELCARTTQVRGNALSLEEFIAVSQGNLGTFRPFA